MHRPTRQHTCLSEKLASKLTRVRKKPGKRAKRWKKWLEQYQPLAQAKQ